MRRFAAAAVLAALVLTACSDDGDDAATVSTTTEAGADADDTTVDDGTDATDDDTTDGTTDAADDEAPADTAADDEDDGADDPGDGDVVPSGDDCPYLATEDLDEAFATTFTLAAASDSGCAFLDGGGLTISLSRIDIAIDPDDYIEGAADTCDPPTTQMVDAGDAAFACIAITPIGTVFEGDVAISLGVLSADDEDAVVDGFARVLPSVTFP